MTDCTYVATHHSDDTVTVYHGTPEPTILCGFHAQPSWLDRVLASRTRVWRSASTDLEYRPGDEGSHPMPCSEVCEHLGVTDHVMRFRVLADGVQLLNADGSRFSFPITHGEAGLYLC